MPFRKQQDFIKPNIQNFSFVEKNLAKSNEVKRHKHKNNSNGMGIVGKSVNFNLKESDKMKGYSEGIDVINEDFNEDEEYCIQHFVPEEKKVDVEPKPKIPETKSTTFKLTIELPDDYSGAYWGRKESEKTENEAYKSNEDKDIEEPQNVKKESKEQRIARSYSEQPKVEERKEDEKKLSDSDNCKSKLDKL